MVNVKEDIIYIFTKIRKNNILSNLRYRNINFRINTLIFTNLSIISYLLYKH
jgi:hypothetical protein